MTRSASTPWDDRGSPPVQRRAVALELGQHEVLLKATDNPEIIVREHDIFVTVT